MNIISSELLALTGILYICLLFYIAWRGDRRLPGGQTYKANSGLIYSLSLAVYCSSWTFFGAVGTASTRGWDFFAIYLGPILLFLFGHRLIQRIILISKQQSITSISDFVSSRYGKSRNIAVLVTCIAVIGSLPYISLQLQATSMAFHTMTSDMPLAEVTANGSFLSDTAFLTAIALAVFTILFGTRHLNATEHHRGMIQAIAFESVVKLLAILAVGYFCYRLLMDSPDLLNPDWPGIQAVASGVDTEWSRVDFFVRMLLSMGAILFLPRQFQVTVVEADSHTQMETARWMLPAYLMLVSLVVLPIAIAGNYFLPGGANADLYVLSLPLSQDQNALATLVFIGGLSAATGMVIVAAISLSTMVCNDIVMPMLLNIRSLEILQRHDLNRIILTIRRIVIVVLMLSSYGYYRIADTSQGLANFGLLSFAAIIQFAPAALIGLYWQRANRRGAWTGLTLGFVAWLYCLLLPNFAGSERLDLIFATASWLHPEHLLGIQGLSPLAHGVFWSLALNIGGLILGSLRFDPSLLDKIQASLFVHTGEEREARAVARPRNSYASILDARTLCESILGQAKTREVFAGVLNPEMPSQAKRPVDRALVQRIEKAIAGVIGASSARHVVAKTLLGEDFSAEDMMVLMDETTEAMRFSRELLQAGFENISQGISVIDRDQKLVAWNTPYVELFDYPPDFLYIGMPVEDVIRFNAARGECGPGEVEQQVSRRMGHLRNGNPHSFERHRRDGRFIKSQGNPMPDGGFVTSYTDITDQKRNEQALLESEQNIRFYTDNLPLMLCFVDKHRRIQFSNKAYNLAVGLSREEITGSTVEEIFGEDYQAVRAAHVDRVLSGHVARFTIRHEEDDGVVTHYLVNYIPQFDDDEAVNGYFCFYQDITQNVAAEDLLRKVNEELEARVAERTLDLEQVNQKLQDATEGKTRFLAAASHDLLQPINAARLFNQSIRETSIDEDVEVAGLADKVDRSLVSADKLLRALLDISKLDAGSMTPEIKQFDIHDLLREIELEMAPIAAKKSLTLKVRKQHISVQSDQRLLRSMIQNFISNAIRYTDQGGVLVGCRRRGRQLEVQVYDSGIGIEEKDQGLIFREFHRLQKHDDSLADKGLGLGLAISSRLSQILGHPINLRSEPGRGSRFSVTVPMGSSNVIPYPERRQWSPTGNLNGLHVLCLENVEEVLEATTILLKRWGCDVTPCRSLAAANEAMDANNIHAVIADYSLDDDEFGLDLLVSARQRGWAGTGIMVTAEQDPEIRRRTREAGFHFLPKPVDPSSLRTLLKRARQALLDDGDQVVTGPGS